jgi:hypothetical protein
MGRSPHYLKESKVGLILAARAVPDAAVQQSRERRRLALAGRSPPFAFPLQSL